jgi:hypothetical protein
MTSFDLPRAESSPALTLKLVAASTTAIIPTDHASSFILIVKPPWVASRHAITPAKLDQQSWDTKGSVTDIIRRTRE